MPDFSLVPVVVAVVDTAAGGFVSASAAAASPASPLRACVFDGRAALSPGIAFSTARPYATVDRAGLPVPPFTPVFDEPRLLAAAPRIDDLVATAGNTPTRVIGSGTWSDGRPAVVYFDALTGGSAHFNVHVGTPVAPGAFASAPAAPGWRRDLRCQAGDAIGSAAKAAGGGIDLLRNAGAGNGESATWRYFPTSAVHVDGMLVCQAVAEADTAGTFQVRSAAVALRGPTDSAPRLHYRHPDTQPGQARGENWTMSAWTRRTDAAGGLLEVVVTFADYRANPNSAGAQYFAVVLYRADAAAAWSVSPCVLVYEEVATSKHAHNMGYWADPVTGDEGFVLLGGDGTVAHTTVVVRAWNADVTSLWAGWTPTGGTTTPSVAPALASAVDGATQNGWTTRRWASGDVASTPISASNQPMGIAPMPLDPRGFLSSSDEGSHSVFSTRIPANIRTSDAKLVWTPLFRDVPSNRFGWLVFGMTHPSRGDREGPFWAVRNPSATSWSPQPAASARLLYSPDGIRWGYAYAPAVAGLQARAYNGAALLGANTVGWAKVRAVRTPVAKVQRPLVVSPGGSNYLLNPLTDGQAATAPNLKVLTGITVVGGEVLQGGAPIVAGRRIPAPPTPNQIARCRFAVGTDNFLGDIRLTAPGNTGTQVPIGRIKVRVWIYPLPPAEPAGARNSPPYNVARMGLIARTIDGASGNGQPAAQVALQNIENSGWQALVFDSDTSAWLVAAPSGPMRLVLRLSHPLSSPNVPFQDFLLAPDFVGSDAGSGGLDFPSLPIPATTVAGTPTGAAACYDAIDGFAAGANWTVELAAMVPEDSWDVYQGSTGAASVAGRPANRRMCTLHERPGRSLRVLLQPESQRIRVTDGTSNIDVVAVAGESFWFDRLSQVLVAISKSGTDYTVMASVGGTRVGIAFGTLADVRPRSIRLADTDDGPVEPLLWFAAAMDESIARDPARLDEDLRSLAMAAVPAGGGSAGLRFGLGV